MIHDVVLADANHLPLKDKQFDAALMVDMIHPLVDPSQTFESVRRIATKGIEYPTE